MTILTKTLQKDGQFPPVTIRINPIRVSPGNPFNAPPVVIDTFIEYRAELSVTIPVNTYSFKFATPFANKPFNTYVHEGDIITISADDVTLFTGLIDTIDIEIDNQAGEYITITGRDLMCQLEDQDVVSLDSLPFYGAKVTIDQVIARLIQDTRIRGLLKQQATQSAYLFATEPSESKLAALQRYCEPLNMLFFMSPDGFIIVGRPNFNQTAKGTLIMSQAKQISNVLNFKATFAAATIPNIIIPIFAAQENVKAIVGKQQQVVNLAPGHNELLSYKHRLVKSVIISNPEGTSPQELASVNLNQFNQNSSQNTSSPTAIGAGGLFQGYAKRELARQNFKEILVQCTVPGHFDDQGNPFEVDSVYYVESDRANIFENMYLYQVEYLMSEDGGPKTNLSLCRLNTIVADAIAP